MEISKEEFIKRAKDLHGDNPENWKFVCSGCKRVQSAKSVRDQMAAGIPSQRYGMLKKGDSLHVESACFSPECNWVANGLFNSGILIIIDPEKPHNSNLKENCSYVFPLEGDAEMLKESIGETKVAR